MVWPFSKQLADPLTTAPRWQPPALKLGSNARRLEIRARRSITSQFSGQYRSAFKGNGLTWSDLREYCPGDDVRAIHWKATARSGHVFVKSFHEEKHRQVFIALDTSQSINTGYPRPKIDQAREFAALVALLAAKNGDALGLALFAEEVSTFLPPQSKRWTKDDIIGRLSAPIPLRAATNLAVSIKFLNQKLKRPALLFILSDFLVPRSEELGAELAILCARHDVVAVHLCDRDCTPKKLKGAGLVAFRDSETGKTRTVDVSVGSAARWEAALRGQAEELQTFIEKSGGSYLRLEDKALPALAAFCRARLYSRVSSGRA